MLRKAALFAFSSSYLTILIEFVSVLVVVRLLSPEEMGIFALSVSFVAILRVLRDFGVSQYIVQESELTEDHLRAAIFITGFFGSFMAVIVYFIVAPFAAIFYESQAIEDVLKLMAFSFLLFPFGAIPLAHLRRNLNFSARFKVEVCASLAKATTAISCALHGLSYMSLAWASLAEAVTIVIIAALVRPPGLPYMPGLRSVKHVFYTSWRLAGGGFLRYIGGAAPALILGKVLGLQAVGLFDRGMASINIFNHVITRSVDTLVLPYFSSSKRAGSSLKNEFLKTNNMITGIAWPFFIFLAFNAAEVIRVLYGEAWVSVAPIVVILSMAQLMSFSCYLYEQFIIAQGRADAFLKLQGILTPLRIILILVAAPYGLEVVAYTFILLALIRFFIVAYYLNKIDSISPLEFLCSSKPSIFIALIAIAVCWGMSALSLFVNIDYRLYLIGEIGFLAIFWLFCVFVFRHPLASEMQRGVDYLKSRTKA